MYRLEAHTSVVLGHPVRCPELQSAVAYPMIPDRDFTESDGDTEWLSGWNFITDIYRGMEHLSEYFRNRRMTVSQQNRSLATSFLLDYDPEKIIRPLATAFLNMPARFKHAQRISRSVRQNRCGFQTANIIATYQVPPYSTGADRLVQSVDIASFYECCRRPPMRPPSMRPVALC